MELKNKKTTLGDEAALYHHREDVSEKEKWATMSGRKRWEYFKSYYLLKLVAVTVSVVAVVSILYTMFAPKPEKILSVAIANGAMTQEQYLKVQADFEAFVQLDEETQETIFDGGYDFEYDLYGSMQKFAIYNAAGDLDITILPLSVFEIYAPRGFFSEIAKRVPAEFLTQFSEILVESRLCDEEGNLLDGTETVFGIRIDATHIFEGYESKEPIVLVINQGSKKEESVVAFLQYLFFPEQGK